MSDMSGPDREKILNYQIDQVGVTVRSASGMQFATWCLAKINNLGFFSPDVQKIAALAHGYPGRTIDDDQKVDFVLILKKLGAITIE